MFDSDDETGDSLPSFYSLSDEVLSNNSRIKKFLRAQPSEDEISLLNESEERNLDEDLKLENNHSDFSLEDLMSRDEENEGV